MRCAAIGLVKEAVLEAFQAGRESPWVSPLFLRVFGKVLFKCESEELLGDGSAGSLERFEESGEARRLVESLGLYYVLLERDVHNLVCSVLARIGTHELTWSRQELKIKML